MVISPSNMGFGCGWCADRVSRDWHDHARSLDKTPHRAGGFPLRAPESYVLAEISQGLRGCGDLVLVLRIDALVTLISLIKLLTSLSTLMTLVSLNRNPDRLGRTQSKAQQDQRRLPGKEMGGIPLIPSDSSICHSIY